MEPVPRHNPSVFIATGALLLLALAIVVAVALYRSDVATLRDPTVDELVANYNAHRQEFRTVERLASVNDTFGIDVATGSYGANNTNAESVPDYLEILEALQAVGAQHVSASDHTLDIVTRSEGLAVSGRESGYFYTTDSDVETITLEQARSMDAPYEWLYPLGDGWYVSDYRF